jgi:transcriptional regulator with XRE-family HTH domain
MYNAAVPMLARKLTPAVPFSLRDRVIERLRAEKERLQWSDRHLAEVLGYSQSKVTQKLNRRVTMTVDELGFFCRVLQISPTETVRDPALDFCAELTPLEMQMLKQFRQLDEATREVVVRLIAGGSRPVKRRSGPKAGVGRTRPTK